jgi:hypothetical protein
MWAVSHVLPYARQRWEYGQDRWLGIPAAALCSVWELVPGFTNPWWVCLRPSGSEHACMTWSGAGLGALVFCIHPWAVWGRVADSGAFCIT